MTGTPDFGASTPGETSGRPKFIGSLHGLRGLFALWVFAFHANPSGIGFLRVSSYGYIAVDAFFILSGYVLMQAHAAEFARVTRGSAFAFLRLRAWRTYPLYFACLLLSLALYPLLKGGGFPSAQRLTVGLLLLEGWAFPGIGINTPIWSLGVEWVGYLAFPLIAFICLRLTPPAAIVILTFLLGGELVLLWNLGALLSDAVVGLATMIRMTAGFGAGCLLWVLHRRLPHAAPATNDLLLLGCSAATVGILLAFPPVCAVPPLTALVHCTARPGPLTARLLGHPVALFMGRISFALYLCHLLVIKVVSLGQPTHSWEYRLIGTLVAGISAIGLATVLCLLIEEPARRFGRRSAASVVAVSAVAD
jgi:peptidoglycan/LPS O-acetylase OafA/YrhL